MPPTGGSSDIQCFAKQFGIQLKLPGASKVVLPGMPASRRLVGIFHLAFIIDLKNFWYYSFLPELPGDSFDSRMISERQNTGNGDGELGENVTNMCLMKLSFRESKLSQKLNEIFAQETHWEILRSPGLPARYTFQNQEVA